MVSVGELAALGTAVCFSFGSTMFTFAGRQIGSPLMNRTRLLMGALLMMAIHWVILGHPLPLDADQSHWGWLALSGLVGFVLGDAFLFQAFVMIGPRLSMLMMALAPVLGAVLAWIFLDEHLNLQEIVGILITISGIGWVVAGGGIKLPENSHPRYYLIGILFGLGGAMGQAGGLVLSKLGLSDDFSPISGNVIRLVSGTIIIWTITTLQGNTAASFRKLGQNPRALRWMTGAVVAGPVIGVWLSLVAVQKAPVGIASTLMSLTPIFLLPVAHFVFHERIGVRAVFGTVIAFIGTALLFL